ncbi:mitochondrial resolvase Ydc2 [Tricladium varicosporioides]|nr:mitochondrial resolvase Ydc2 [Hymenoscyphus varicosporioides]
MAAIHIPTTLKATQLRQIAYKCGILFSGTKTLLTQRLHDELSVTAQQETRTLNSKTASARPIRILSIDVGIRNLAYCVLDVSPGKKKGSKTELPTVIEWHRLSVSTPPQTSKGTITNSKEKEDFSPLTLSQKCYTLLRSRLLPHNPTYILIERQRFRSMGSKHILEWTIRVNMFESMLYATLCTLKAEGVWNGNIEAIAPGKVGPFWIAEDEDRGVEEFDGASKKVRVTKNTKAKNKGAKIDLVRKWLNSEEMMRLGNEGVESVGKAYMDRWSRSPGAMKGSKRGEQKDGGKMGKLDDLADSLLQGMAWIQWEENKRLAIEKGVEVLLEP